MNPSAVQILFADLQPEIAAIFGLPMLFSVVPEGGKTWSVMSELAEHAKPANTFQRMTATPWLDPATVDARRASGRTTLVVAGFATEVVSLHSVLGGIAAGYRVLVPVDANGGMSAATEAAALRPIETRRRRNDIGRGR